MRTLAFAVDGRFQQIFAISDPIRDEVPGAIARCHDAGIGVKIVTGDTAATAAEIGRQIGVVSSEPNASQAVAGLTQSPELITGPERSEEGRVGKECRSRWSPDPLKKKEQ